MTVISVVPDQQAHTLTLTAQYAAPVEDVWQLWADPRQLERWWGPPTYPATVLDHDLSVGGRVRYVMTGPEGDQHAGWWRIAAVAAPTGLEFDDGFGDPDAPSPSLPVSRTRITISAVGGGVTRMVLATSGVGGAHVRTARARSRLRRRRPARACEGLGLPDTAAGAGAGSARRSGSRSRPRPWLPTNLELTDLERTDFHLAGAQSAHHRISNREAADRERPHCRGG